ncbi:MAG TPA: hypothetical protein VL769_14780 [Acidimicrobiia bacterium]|nr:hypothetical protein [Acidimicrobiia bacterium]
MAVVIEPTPTPGHGGRSAGLRDGMLLAGRYRVLHGTQVGWVAYDERLARTVLIVAIAGDGSAAERVRREASMGAGLLDAVVFGGDAFAVRTSARAQ